MQTQHGMDAKDFAEAKQTLRSRLKALEDELNRYLAGEYGVPLSSRSGRKTKGDSAAYEKWLKSHQPFHWFVEFYGIMQSGGFDVIIGNPPYLEYSKVKEYEIRGYATENCANLYAYTVERSLALSSLKGRAGMIIPISVACSGAIEPLRNYFYQTSRKIWLSHFSNRPGQLFTGAQNRLTIFLVSRQELKPKSYSTRYHRWDAKNGERDNLFPTLCYQELARDNAIIRGLLPKSGCLYSANVLSRIAANKTAGFLSSKHGKYKVFWVRVPGYFCQFMTEPPIARPENGGPARIRGEVNEIGFDDETTRNIVHAVLNSSTYYQFFCTYTDTRHINPSDVYEFPLDLSCFSNEVKATFKELSAQLTHCFSINKTQWRKSGLLIDSIDSKPCKSTLDKIDQTLACHYGFTEEELDFIINYDIKYRMGRDAEVGEE
jgi:hypothetical protein